VQGRREVGWTQEDLAHNSRLSVGTIKRAEKGKSFHPGTYRSICEELNKERLKLNLDPVNIPLGPVSPTFPDTSWSGRTDRGSAPPGYITVEDVNGELPPLLVGEKDLLEDHLRFTTKSFLGLNVRKVKRIVTVLLEAPNEKGSHAKGSCVKVKALFFAEGERGKISFRPRSSDGPQAAFHISKQEVTCIRAGGRIGDGVPVDLVGDGDTLLEIGTYPDCIADKAFVTSEARGHFLVEVGDYTHHDNAVDFYFAAGGPNYGAFAIHKRYELEEGTNPDYWFRAGVRPLTIEPSTLEGIKNEIAALVRKARLCSTLPPKGNEYVLGREDFVSGRYAPAFRLMEKPNEQQRFTWISDHQPEQTRDVFYIWICHRSE